MKRLARIWYLFGLVLLAACTPSFKAVEPVEMPTAELVLIDSLMWQQPDSALARLMPIFDTCMTTEYNRRYANLLLAELLYKNDYAQTNRIELQQAVSYFDSLVRKAPPFKGGGGILPPLKGGARRAGDSKTHPNRSDNLPFLTARAHYINGVGYYEQDSVVEACKEYLKAIEVMEEHFEEKTLTEKKANFMALAYTHLTSLFSDQYLHEQAIYFGKKAWRYYNKYDAQVWHLAWLFDEIGSNYNVIGNLDSAMAYFNKGIEMLHDTNNLAYRDLAVHKAFLSYVINKNSNTVLNKLRCQIVMSESKREYLSRCLTIGEILFHEQQFDSAFVYLSEVFQCSKSINSKKQAAEWLVEICKAQDNEDEIIKYTNFLAPFATQDENKSFVKSQLAELYNGSKQYELEHQHRQTVKRQTIWVIVFASGLLTVVLALFVLYKKYKRKKQNLEIQIKEEEYAHKIEQKALSGRLKRSNATIKEYGRMIRPTTPQQKSTAEKYEDEPICLHILSLCNDPKNPIKSTVPISAYTNIALDDAQKAQLKNAAMMHYGPMFEKLKLQQPKLKEKDFQYFYLCLLGLDNIQIAVMLQNSISTIWEREKRLKKIFCSEDRVAISLHGYMMD